MHSTDIHEVIDQAGRMAEENLKLLGEMQGALTQCKMNKQMLYALVLERCPLGAWAERSGEVESMTSFLQAHGVSDLKNGGFQVFLAPGVPERMDGLLEMTDGTWLPDDFLQSWVDIHQKLSASPREWGETLVTRPDMVVQSRVISKWLVIFGTHAKKPCVWVHSITPMPDHPVFTITAGSGVAV